AVSAAAAGDSFATVPVIPKDEPVPPVPVAPVPPRTPGARPITVMVSIAPRDVVARTVVNWGFRDSAGHSGSGRQVFGPEAGVTVGGTPRARPRRASRSGP